MYARMDGEGIASNTAAAAEQDGVGVQGGIRKTATDQVLRVVLRAWGMRRARRRTGGGRPREAAGGGISTAAAFGERRCWACGARGPRGVLFFFILKKN